MHIGFDAKRLFHNRTGLGNYGRTLVGNLLTYAPAHRYYLYTPSRPVPSPADELAARDGITVRQARRWGALWRSFLVGNQLKKDGIAIYHGLSHEIPLHLPPGVRSLVTIHDLIFEKFPHLYPLVDRRIYRQKFRYACRHADHIIAISDNTKRDIIELYGIAPEKVSVIYQACHPRYYVSGAPDQMPPLPAGLPPQYMLYVGSLEPRKNIGAILSAMARLSPDIRLPLVAVGRDSRYRKKLVEQAEKLRISKEVIWLTNVTDDAVLQRLYLNAQVLVYPSRYEGFGLPVAEALLSRTPVVTSSTSALPEAGGPDSLYVDPGDTNQLAAAIERALTDTELRQRMIEKGFVYAKRRFDPQSLTSRLTALYRRVRGD